MLVSVIVPIYNIQNYVSMCIDSIIKQEYKKLEIILVDDGSQDNSGTICEKYAQSDSRIKVIHKKNGGLSDARNVGILASTGEYVLFLDGDDFWDDVNAVSQLVNRIKITNADILNFSYTKWYENQNIKEPYFDNIDSMPIYNDINEQLDYLTLNGLYIASACNKLIRRDLLRNVMFDCGIYSEDINWCARLMLNAKSMDFICCNFYIYRQRLDSIRYSINDKKCKDLTNNIIDCIELLEGSPVYIKKHLLRYTAFQLGTFFMVQAQAENKQDECIKMLQEYSWLLKYHGKNKKIILLNLGCKLFSFSKVCEIIRLVFRKGER